MCSCLFESWLYSQLCYNAYFENQHHSNATEMLVTIQAWCKFCTNLFNDLLSQKHQLNTTLNCNQLTKPYRNITHTDLKHYQLPWFTEWYPARLCFVILLHLCIFSIEKHSFNIPRYLSILIQKCQIVHAKGQLKHWREAWDNQIFWKKRICSVSWAAGVRD